MRGVVIFTLVIVSTILLCVPASPKDKPRTYETGKLLDLAVEDVVRGTAIIGNIAAPIPGRLYVFQIQLDGLIYFAEYKAGKNSYKPDWVVNDPIEVRLEKDSKMFLKRADGKELEVAVTKKVRGE